MMIKTLLLAGVICLLSACADTQPGTTAVFYNEDSNPHQFGQYGYGYRNYLEPYNYYNHHGYYRYQQYNYQRHYQYQQHNVPRYYHKEFRGDYLQPRHHGNHRHLH